MSQANIPNITPNINLSLDDALNLTLASIALEELGLAHVINSEAEKIQYALGTIPGLSPAASLEDLLAVNESVNHTLQNTIQQEMLLQRKLDNVLQTISDNRPPIVTCQNASGSVVIGGTQTVGNNQKIDYTGGNFDVNNMSWDGVDTFTILEDGLYYAQGMVSPGATQAGPIEIGAYINEVGVGGPSFSSGRNNGTVQGQQTISQGVTRLSAGDTISLYNISGQQITLSNDVASRFTLFRIDCP